ncbi:MAG: hypothetical protein M1825_000736 [Sarcosagium campestre]|nr:MAG: hypothetical protein M1825_000736 [Sarcosagium campestre]
MPPDKSPLLSLPIELRLHIFQYALATQGLGYKKSIGLLGTCRQINREAAGVLFHENLFALIYTNYHNLTTTLENYGLRTFYVANDGLDEFPHAALKVRLNFTKVSEESDGPWEPDDDSFLILQRDLDAFCSSLLVLHFILPLNLSDLVVELDVQGTENIPTVRQHLLLDPFRSLRGVLEAVVEGSVSADYAEQTRKHFTTRIDERRQALKMARDMKNEGARYYRAKNYRIAEQRFTQIQYMADRFEEHTREDLAEDEREELTRAWDVLEFEVHYNKTLTSLKMGRMRDAEQNASDAIRIGEAELWAMEDVPTLLQISRCYFRRALVYLMIKRMKDFEADMNYAAQTHQIALPMIIEAAGDNLPELGSELKIVSSSPVVQQAFGTLLSDLEHRRDSLVPSWVQDAFHML